MSDPAEDIGPEPVALRDAAYWARQPTWHCAYCDCTLRGPLWGRDEHLAWHERRAEDDRKCEAMMAL